jgi:hypothetical protein
MRGVALCLSAYPSYTDRPHRPLSSRDLSGRNPEAAEGAAAYRILGLSSSRPRTEVAT